MSTETIPEFWPGLCECGCGEVTRIAAQTAKSKGWTKGEPLRFCLGHNARGQTLSSETREKVAAAQRGVPKSPEHVRKVAESLRGRPGLKGPDNPTWKGDEAGESAIHKWLNDRHPKTGLCDECGVGGRLTHYAFKKHPEPYTRDRNDCRELCSACHRRFDGYTADQGWHNAGWEKRRQRATSA
jgi:hypothetical protein